MESAKLKQQQDQSIVRDVKKAKVEETKKDIQQCKDNLKAISSELDKQRTINEETVENNKACSRTAKAELRRQNDEVKQFFVKLEHDMEMKIDAIKDENDRKQELVNKKLQELQGKLQKLLSEAENNPKSEQKLEEEIKALEERVASLINENKVTNYKYQQSQQIQEMLATVTELGSIAMLKQETSPPNEMTTQKEAVETNPVTNEVTQTTGDAEKLGHPVALHTRTKEDKQQSTITGLCIMPGGFLAVVDYGNCSVKMIDTKEDRIISVLAIKTDPHDVTMVTDTSLAVTLFYRKKIQFISLDDSKMFSLTSALETDSPCYGVIHRDDKITVTQGDKIEILDKKGKVLQRFDSASTENQLFSHAKYVTMSPDLNIIYVSDYNNNTVTALTIDGKVKASYKDPDLQMPYGLAVDSTGSVFACGYNSSNIHKLSADLSSGKVVLDESDGIVMPQSIAYCSPQNRLYVGMWCNDTIRVYQM